MDTQERLADMALVSAKELAEIEGCAMSTVNRRLEALRLSASADYVVAGRSSRPERRWFLTKIGLYEVFPERHRHGKIYPDHSHYHSYLFLDDMDHQHPGKIPTATGLLWLADRLVRVEAFYKTAASLFLGKEGQGWLKEPGDVRLKRWLWLQGDGLVHAVGEYDQVGYVGFCWVGKQARVPNLRKMWRERYLEKHLDLDMPSYSPVPIGLFNLDDQTLDLSWDLSGYVVVGADLLSVLQARQNLPTDNGTHELAFMFKTLNDEIEPLYDGRVRPLPHRVADRFADHDIGSPGTKSWGKHWNTLNGVLVSRILGLIEEWDALTAADIRKRCPQAGGKQVIACLKAMVEAGFVFVWDGHHYLGKEGAKYVARRDGVPFGTVWKRVKGYNPCDQKHVHTECEQRRIRRHRGQLRHNKGVNAIAWVLTEAGIPVFNGWRGVINIAGNTQVSPDLVVAIRTRGHEVLCYIEYERTAVNPTPVERKESPYFRAALAGRPIPVIFVCEKPEAAHLFQVTHRKLTADSKEDSGGDYPGFTLMTATLDEVLTGPVVGEWTVWKDDGVPVSVLKTGEPPVEWVVGHGTRG